MTAAVNPLPLDDASAADARGAPVEVDVGTLASGELRTAGWRGKPVWLMRRSDNIVRPLRPERFVALGLCTHLGCSPTLRLDDAGLAAELRASGGFLGHWLQSRHEGIRVAVEATARHPAAQVLELARLAEQVDPGVLQQLAAVLSEAPLGGAGLSAAALMLIARHLGEHVGRGGAKRAHHAARQSVNSADESTHARSACGSLRRR